MLAGFSAPSDASIRVMILMPLSSALQHVERETELQIQRAIPAAAEPSSEATTLRSTEIGMLNRSPDDLPYSLPWLAFIGVLPWDTSESALFIIFNF